MTKRTSSERSWRIFLLNLHFKRGLFNEMETETYETYHRCRFTCVECAGQPLAVSVLASARRKDEFNKKSRCPS